MKEEYPDPSADGQGEVVKYTINHPVPDFAEKDTPPDQEGKRIIGFAFFCSGYIVLFNWNANFKTEMKTGKHEYALDDTYYTKITYTQPIWGYKCSR